MNAAQVPSPGATEFFSLNGVLAIMLVLVLVGKGADWLLLRHHKEELLAKVTLLGDYLRGVDFASAQMDLVKALLGFLTLASVPWTVRKHPSVTGKADRDLEASEIVAVLAAVFARPIGFILALTIFALWALGFLNFHYASLLVVLAGFLVLKTLFWLLHMAAVGQSLAEEPKEPLPSIIVWVEHSRVVGYLDALGARMLVVSFALSVVAIEVGLGFWTNPQASPWFAVGASGVELTEPLILVLMNLPFDVLAIIITILLLKYGLTGKAISLIALVDIGVTLLLLFVLFVLLLAWPFTSVANWSTALDTTTLSLLSLLSFMGSTDDPLFPLYPLLLTPFAPIGFYLLLPLLLAIVLRPLFRIGGYLCKVFGQKENSPFFEIAGGLALLVAVIKALAEWPWLTNAIAQFLS